MNARSSPTNFVDVPRPPHGQDMQPCFGVGCMARGSCACYDAVGSAPEALTRQGTCARDGAYPGYRALATAPGLSRDGWPRRAQPARQSPSEPLISGSSVARSAR